jgi:hypothetical protein
MIKLRKRTFYFWRAVAFLGVFFFGIKIVDTELSFKYEADYGDCYSKLDGSNLCVQYYCCIALTILSFVSLFLLVKYRKKICLLE